MPKVQDLKAYTRDVFTKAGLEGDALKQVLAAIDDEKVLKSITDHFKPLPDYSHDMDDVRNKTKAEKDQEQLDWYQKEQQKYNEYVNGLAELERLRKIHEGTPAPARGDSNMTQQDINKLVEAQLQANLETILTRRDQAYLAFRDADFDHMKRFNKPMDRVAFEKQWKDHPEWGGELFNAYEKWIAPEVEKSTTAMWEEKIKQAREEGIRDGFTRRQIPTDHQPKEFSPFFDRKEDVAKMSEKEQENHSRQSFFDELMKPTTA